MKKFTQEIKDMWINALKSGNYKQGYNKLVRTMNGNKSYCCIGVLAEVHPELANDIHAFANGQCPYMFLKETIGEDKMDELWKTNDSFEPKNLSRPENYQDDYSNVIPLIEALPVQE